MVILCCAQSALQRLNDCKFVLDIASWTLHQESDVILFVGEIMRKSLILALTFSSLGCASLKPNGADERSPSSESSKATPRLFIQPAPVFDMVCALKTGFKLDPTMQAKFQKELYAKIPQFQSAWDSRAAHLISESERAAGRTFKRQEYSVAMILCDWIPMGDPAFIVSAFPYLGPSRKMNGFDMPVGMSEFVSMTHHELLHSLVDNIINPEFSNTSTLLEKYKGEPFNVLVHLHLMAIQKATYLKLKDNELLKATDDLYAFIGGDYKRAWQIIGIEGTEKFLAELQSFNSKHQ